MSPVSLVQLTRFTSILGPKKKKKKKKKASQKKVTGVILQLDWLQLVLTGATFN